MIVAKTRCHECGDIIELDDEYGWTEGDCGRTNMLCNCCIDDYESFDEFEN